MYQTGSSAQVIERWRKVKSGVIEIAKSLSCSPRLRVRSHDCLLAHTLAQAVVGVGILPTLTLLRHHPDPDPNALGNKARAQGSATICAKFADQLTSFTEVGRALRPRLGGV